MLPPPSNSDHKDYYMFSRGFLLTFTFHCYREGAISKVYDISITSNPHSHACLSMYFPLTSCTRLWGISMDTGAMSLGMRQEFDWIFSILSAFVWCSPSCNTTFKVQPSPARADQRCNKSFSPWKRSNNTTVTRVLQWKKGCVNTEKDMEMILKLWQPSPFQSELLLMA